MKKLILRPRDWPKALGAKFDDLFSGGTPFMPPWPSPIPPWSIGSAMEHESLRRQQDFAYRQSMAGRAAMMGGLGGQLLAQLMGAPPLYASRTGGHLNILKEGKVDVQVNFTRIDKEHVLVQVECIQRIAHNKKELREVTAELIEKYAEQYVFGEPPKDPRGPQHEPGTTMAKEPPGGMEKEAKK